jgi:hypothetical protein
MIAWMEGRRLQERGREGKEEIDFHSDERGNGMNE